jgi:hypothetical protein
MSKIARAVVSVAVTLGVVIAATVAATHRTEALPPATIDPADFSNPQPNLYFPLDPGRVSRYRGIEDGERFRERVEVTERTKQILGVTTVVVIDVLHVDGRLAERTEDWYQADNDGTVWYFGEDTAEYDRHGNVISSAGSWEAGVDGARPGVIMPADPRPSDAYFQEFYRGEAEDQGWVVHRREVVRVPYGRVSDVLRTYEWSRLEPAVVVMKQYGPGLGIVRERVVAGEAERLELVDVRGP